MSAREPIPGGWICPNCGFAQHVAPDADCPDCARYADYCNLQAMEDTMNERKRLTVHMEFEYEEAAGLSVFDMTNLARLAWDEIGEADNEIAIIREQATRRMEVTITVGNWPPDDADADDEISIGYMEPCEQCGGNGSIRNTAGQYVPCRLCGGLGVHGPDAELISTKSDDADADDELLKLADEAIANTDNNYTLEMADAELRIQISEEAIRRLEAEANDARLTLIAREDELARVTAERDQAVYWVKKLIITDSRWVHTDATDWLHAYDAANTSTPDSQ